MIVSITPRSIMSWVSFAASTFVIAMGWSSSSFRREVVVSRSREEAIYSATPRLLDSVLHPLSCGQSLRDLRGRAEISWVSDVCSASGRDRRGLHDRWGRGVVRSFSTARLLDLSTARLTDVVGDPLIGDSRRLHGG